MAGSDDVVSLPVTTWGSGLVLVVTMSADCGDDSSSPTGAPLGPGSGYAAAQPYPDVIAAEALPAGNGTWTFTVTITVSCGLMA